MATIYRASLASIIAINGDGTPVPLGVVQNLRLQKRYAVEGVPEIGSFRWAEILIHGYNAMFSWGKAWSKGVDLVAQGLIPEDATIASFQPMALRVIDQEAQRQIAFIFEGVLESLDIGIDARAKLMQDVTGQAITLLVESELN
jgi:hypothetical protein